MRTVDATVDAVEDAVVAAVVDADEGVDAGAAGAVVAVAVGLEGVTGFSPVPEWVSVDFTFCCADVVAVAA